MFCRREALLSAGLLDERFFIYSEEPDLCLRMKRAGWATRHLPTMTIVHHAGKGGLRPKMIAQDVFTRRQYARQAPRGTPSRGLSGRRRGPARGARHHPRGWGRAAAPGRRAAGPAHARRARGAAVRRSAADGDQPRAHALADPPPRPGTTRSGGLRRPDVSGTKRSGTSWRTFGGAYAPGGVADDMGGISCIGSPPQLAQSGVRSAPEASVRSLGRGVRRSGRSRLPAMERLLLRAFPSTPR